MIGSIFIDSWGLDGRCLVGDVKPRTDRREFSEAKLEIVNGLSYPESVLYFSFRINQDDFFVIADSAQN